MENEKKRFLEMAPTPVDFRAEGVTGGFMPGASFAEGGG